MCIFVSNRMVVALVWKKCECSTVQLYIKINQCKSDRKSFIYSKYLTETFSFYTQISLQFFYCVCS